MKIQAKKKKQTGGGRGPNVVTVDGERMDRLKKHKEKTGVSILFFVSQAIDNEFKRLESGQ